jgi:hypothetical protein
MTAAFWPLLAMVELAALLIAVLVCVALAIAGVAVQVLRRRSSSRPARPAPSARAARAQLVEHDDEQDPFPF